MKLLQEENDTDKYTLVIVVVEPSQCKLFQNYLQKLKRTNLFILQLPTDNTPASIGLDISKLISEKFAFPFSWSRDQLLEECRYEYLLFVDSVANGVKR